MSEFEKRIHALIEESERKLNKVREVDPEGELTDATELTSEIWAYQNAINIFKECEEIHHERP